MKLLVEVLIVLSIVAVVGFLISFGYRLNEIGKGGVAACKVVACR